MDKVIGFMINNDNFHEITNENTEMLSNIFSEENVKMKEILDRLIYTSVENEHNQKEIIRFKKSILIKQKTDNIKNNLFFTTKFDDFENMEFDFFKNEYSILENTNKMLKTPHELLTARLYQHIVYHRNAPDYLEYLKSKGVDYNYKIISQISMLSQDRIDESFQENSLLLDTITENQIKFHDTSNKNLIKSIKHLFSKTEIINKPGCLTLMNVKENPYISENSNSDILNFLHIKDIQNLLEKI